MHASLGDVEWPGALEHAQQGAERAGLEFAVARATKSFFEMVEHRFAVRPSSPSWPSASNRQCTSDLKRGPIEREIRRIARERGTSLVVNCTGIRADESTSRAKQVPLRQSDRNSKAGRTWFDWMPIFQMSRADVLATVAAAGESLHSAYASGNDRLSCMFCIMGSRNDLRNAAIQNPTLYRRYLELEARTGYTMHQSRKPLDVLTGIRLEHVQ
jgi:3'-phosphoadenosine 5'-phosphosulfate sulfotransferase (PAPS reductase)/FAD synthetase